MQLTWGSSPISEPTQPSECVKHDTELYLVQLKPANNTPSKYKQDRLSDHNDTAEDFKRV